MKNVLFATTALVGFAGVAFAQDTGVSLSGSAEMGVTYIDTNASGFPDDSILETQDGDEVEWHNDIDITFTLSGATETGLTFGASIDLDESDGGSVIEDSNSVFISGAWGTLSMGDVDGAYDQALDGIAAGGLNDEADLASGTPGLDGFGDTEILRYDYAFGPVTLSGSLALEEGPVDNVWGFGIAYTNDFGGWTLDAGAGVQYTSTDDPESGADYVGLGDGDHWVYGASATVGFGNFQVIGVIESYDRPDDFNGVVLATALPTGTIADLTDPGDIVGIGGSGEIYGISGQYFAGPWEFALGYEFSDLDIERNLVQGYTTYDLGGGAEIVAAASWSDVQNPDGPEELEIFRMGFGLGFSF
ncbi:porin [Halovulum sp. GXIMD14794]